MENIEGGKEEASQIVAGPPFQTAIPDSVVSCLFMCVGG